MTFAIDQVTVVPGAGQEVVECATVTVDDNGTVVAIEPTDGASVGYLIPAAVDVHLDNVRERRRPRATVELALSEVIPMLDVECAAAGVGTLLVSGRFEHEPRKGVILSDALALCELIEDLYPTLACDWYIHARVEVTDDGVIEALQQATAASSRIKLISMMDHSAERSRFASVEEHRQFYAADFGVSLDEIDAIIERKRDGAGNADERRRMVANIAQERSITLVSHDDRTAAQIDDAASLGATVAEFPLSTEAARRAHELGMSIVLGAPNAARGRSTSPGNILVADAVSDGLCDILCSDYLPSSLVRAVFRLSDDGVMALKDGVGLLTSAASVVGVAEPVICVGQPLNASLRQRVNGVDIGMALWRQGELMYQRSRIAVRQV
ncbi:MAG TPA: alpha-D-ribose 1-methylphosphonate 5-triphosphate diphosphatase [Acidimicrobiales bacterium]|jgi:alpha-D-ribose 1-methylphosphonate 5-triphosphate diphosphatase|nr:alpha-D-ribose 1-methylphosphonate 5-triphosphate diphosphatase [Acidimicrobiales bacterium]